MVGKILFGAGGRARGNGTGDGDAIGSGVADLPDAEPDAPLSELPSAEPHESVHHRRFTRAWLLPAAATVAGLALALSLGAFLSPASPVTDVPSAPTTGRPAFEDEFLQARAPASIPAVPLPAGYPELEHDDLAAPLAAQQPMRSNTGRSSAPVAASSGSDRSRGAHPFSVPSQAAVTSRPPSANSGRAASPAAPRARTPRPGQSPGPARRAQPIDPDSVLPPTVP